jgi:hypothetical protein
MKKLVLNISDTDYEKFRFEAIHERKSVLDVIKGRLLSKPFHNEVKAAFENWMSENLNAIMNQE